MLFGGYRPWTLYPIQYLTSSVPQFLLYTPQSLWQSRQHVMNDEHGLLDTAERWHARYVVPYANGGAPWYWERGLGAVGDGSASDVRSHFDPLPEAVVSAASRRSQEGARALSSVVRTLIMRPGESLDFDDDGDATIVPNPGHAWPYTKADAVANMLGSTAEPVGLSRKRVLLRVLAAEEMRRRGRAVSTQQIADMSDDLRIQNGLTEHADMVAWLDTVGLSMAEYCDILLEWQAVLAMEDEMADAIEKRSPANVLSHRCEISDDDRRRQRRHSRARGGGARCAFPDRASTRVRRSRTGRRGGRLWRWVRLDVRGGLRGEHGTPAPPPV